MRRIFIFCLLFPFLLHTGFAQVPTQAEIDKMMKDAQSVMKKYGNDSLVKKATNNNLLDGTPTSGRKTDTTAFMIPARNNKLINALPIRCFNKTELISYLHNLRSKLSEYLRSKHGTDISGIPEAVSKQSGAAIGLWMAGGIRESVLVSIKAAELNPENNLLLNNTGGILTNCGLGYYGIPVLEYVLQQQPGNNMILNNLGQAYFDLGDDKKAEEYLLKCVSSYKYYPDANLALAYIYNSRGNKGAAINYAENSLRGGWSSKADNLLAKLKPGARMIDYVRHRYKQPAYFSVGKFHMLQQCTSVDQIALLEPQYVGYKKMIERAMAKYQQLLAKATIASVTSVQDEIKAVSKTKKKPYRPFGMFGNAVLESLRKEYKEKAVKLEQFRKAYYKERDSVNKRYEKELKDIRDKYEKMEFSSDEDRCNEINALSNLYLPLYAEPTEILQRKTLAYYKDYLNDMAYWSYVASINDDAFHMDFYRMVIEFLGRLNEISTTRFMETKYDTHRFYPCEFQSGGSINTADAALTTPDCYLTPKIEADLGAFKLEISCETYKIEAGEGLVGKIEYTRGSGDLTLAFGVGYAVPKVFFESPGIKAGIEAEAKSQVYITFDQTMTPTDLGVLWEAELKGVIEMGKFKESIGHEEGLTAGFGSGVQLKDNSLLKEAIDRTYPVQPDDKQINKNIPLYRK
ncbi:MAG TPA: tetratricopeptide repeat protein [Chitinophagaceae bacterium]|nr:tetratricopeptide repeat protein [Chitinophagaceae bacterium]